MITVLLIIALAVFSVSDAKIHASDAHPAGTLKAKHSAQLRARAPGCQTQLGAYFLSKTLLRVDVAKPPSGPAELAVAEMRVADKTRAYCLDFLATLFAHDRIVVRRTAEKLLEQVGPKDVVDRLYVGEAALHFAEALAGAASAADTSPPITARFEFNPFEATEAAGVNAGLAVFGFCLVLDGYSFDSDKSDVQRYCTNPTRQAAKPLSYSRAHASEAQRILYRTPKPYRLLVYVSDRAEVAPSWRLFKSTIVSLENIAPIVGMKVDPALFIERSASLVFDQGVFVGAAIQKPNASLGFLEIPLEVVRGVVALPAEMIRVQINRSTGAEALLAEQAALIALQKAYLEQLAKGDP